ncbi:hypothetical protein [Campylobacter showae]|uniref:Replication initiation factor n=1 Tax=Campylobacter showae CC57C TaxID=1073353 RepID=M3JEH9_9BACT|nr:hypothetical protein [Campylobacter showae]EMG31067.1 hypothetical protein H740_03232 [Campylobacter showae CC57C]
MQVISEPKIVHQGIDTLVFGINCTDEAVFLTKFKRFVSIVKTAKEAAQAVYTFCEKFYKTDLGLTYGDFFVSSKGLGGSYFGFVKNDDVFFSVSDTDFEANSLYHIKLQFRSIYLLKYGFIVCIEQVKKFLNDIFDGKFEIKILRLDVCSDVAGIKYTPVDFFNFRSLKKISHFSQATIKETGDDSVLVSEDDTDLSKINLADINVNNFMRFNRFEGMSFGKNPDMFRVYDKIKQIEQKNISTLIFTKWELNGFNFDRDKYVFRHEAEFGRLRIRKLMPIDVKDEVDYLINNVGRFWATGLNICKWYDLRDKEREKLSSSSIQIVSIRKIYQRCDQDETRLKFWDFLADWDENRFTKLSKHDFIKSKDLKQAKKALKAFVSAVYTNLGYDFNNFLVVLDEVKKDLDKQGLNLHEYGLSKLAGNFNKNEKTIKDCGLCVDNPLTSSMYYGLDEFIIALKEIRSEEYKKPIKDALKILQAQRFED